MFTNRNIDSELSFQMIEENEKRIADREKEIQDISRSINDLANIFKQMANMIAEQGTVLDRIDYNIEQSAIHMEKATDELELGAKYQKKAEKKKLILVLGIVAFILLMGIIIKHS